ncbi:hypothetical protein [Marinobacter subterrani]|uniref:Prophage tail length tape measure protein n=1 Tax=Marinobacter subterrani TaxID=1658765 RepID=A0A0J7JA26_9GAMM|nr:hypothetical protein [Marinobacter subterrani]KMQ75303.1 hypothetical protein Msub_11505 [Marinobacter subterrani]
MALKDSIINLVLKGKDLISPATESASESVSKLQERSTELSAALEKLTNTERNISQFRRLGQETERLKANWQDAEYELEQLKAGFEATEKPTKAMARELQQAEKAAEDSKIAWARNRQELDKLSPQLKAAGVNLENLDQSQDDVQQSAMRLRSDLTAVNTQLNRQEAAAKEAAQGTEALGDQADKTSGVLSKLGAGLQTIITGAAALAAGIGASVATLTLFSRSQASVADALTNTSNAIGVNREALQVWQIAGERVGLTGEKVTDILRGVTERLGEFAATGGGEAVDVMERLNLSVEDFQGLRPEGQMLRFAQAIEGLPKAEQVALLEMLASDASQLQPLLEKNAAGLKAIAAEARQAGAIYSEEELDKLVRANDIYNTITTKIQGLTRRIGIELAPAVADASDKLLALFNQNEGADKLVELFKRLITWAGEMGTSLIENADSIGRAFGKLWDTIQSGASGAMAVFRGLQTVVAGWATGVAGSFATVLSIVQGVAFALNEVGAVSDQAYNSIRAKAEAARATTQALAEQTVEYGRKAIESGIGVVTAFDDAAKSADKLEKAVKRGVGTLEKMPDKIKPVKQETDNATESADKLTEAYKTLGVTSQAELNKAATTARDAFAQISESGTATQEKVSSAFQAYAQAVIETGDAAKIKALETEAANLGLRDALKEVQTQADKTGTTAAGNAQKTADETDKAAKSTKDLADETKKAAAEAEEARNKFRETWGAAFAKAISNAREQVTALSAAARNLFEIKIGGNAFVGETRTAAEALERATQRTEELASARRRLMSNSFAAWFADTALAAAQVEKQFYAQAVALENLTEKVNSGSLSMSQLSRLSETASNKFNLLDQQRLSGLQSAIDAAKQKMQSLSDTADSTLSSLRQRLADIQGDTEEAQRIQFEQERKRLQEQLEQAREAGADAAAADYQQSLDTLEKIYQVEQRNRREQENAREKAAADRAREQQLAELQRQKAERSASTTTNRQDSVQSRPTQTIVLQGPGGAKTEVQTSDPSALLQVLEETGLRSS